MYNFKKQNYIEVERGIEYMNYQREVAKLTDFSQKTAKRSKNEETKTKKSQKLTKKIRKYVPISHLKRNFICKILCYRFTVYNDQKNF